MSQKKIGGVCQRLGLFVILFFLSIAVYTQTSSLGSVSGKIFEKGTNNVVPGVHVFIEGTKIGTITNGAGYFELIDIPEGDHRLITSSVGFGTFKHQILVKEGSVVIDLYISENITEIPGIVIERLTLTGGTEGVKNIPGSAHYISPKELQKFNHTDVNRVLRNIPGVNIQEEDGFGLRPNIGFRGTGVERSSKITLMEDGVLMAPAPYAAPAAYYFPIFGRMQGVEIRKGSSQIKYGPYTTGGAINLISTQIPDAFGGRLNILGGSFGGRTIHANVGHSFKNVGFLVESFQAHSQGFKDLDNHGDTGFDTQDVIAKLRFNTNEGAKIPQSITFKVGISTETSDETYLGLTQADFDKTPYRRYSGSQVDQMNTEQSQILIRHTIKPISFLDITTSFYRTEFDRNWYKLDKVKASDIGEKVSISNVLNDPILFNQEYSILTGLTSANADALFVKANNRSYYSQGFETLVGFEFETGPINHSVEIGLRIHQDAMDRFQWVDEYKMDEGVMKLTVAGEHGSESNRIESAKATASFIQYKMQMGKFTVTPGLRYENISIKREDYGKEDTERLGTDLSIRENKVDVFIPGIGLDYKLTNSLSAFAGVNKGFSPPGSTEGAEPEESFNYEAGGRLSKSDLYIQAVVFLNDYKNLLGSDLAGAGGSGTTQQFNGGQVLVSGIELEARYTFIPSASSKFNVPVNVSYTRTNAKFQNNFESDFEPWGTVEDGDQLPYLAANQFAFNLGLEHKRFNLNLSSKYIDEMRTVAGQGKITDTNSIDSQFILDFSGNYSLHRKISLFGSVNNVTNKAYVVSARPAGLRPGMPRSFMVGIKAQF